MSIPSREAAFLRLVERVSQCRVCPRMEGRTRVLSAANGNLQAQILFVAEAPGRFGGDRCGIPLSQDQTGRNFQLLLDKADIPRETIFITNAVLCNPRDEQGRNAPPTRSEISNCVGHLKETIEIIQPRFVVTLGTVALQTLKTMETHSLQLSQDVGRCISWYERRLVPLYHPGPRAQLHRSFEKQIEDFQNLAKILSQETEPSD
jgi:uracil-DNA glycosylase